MFYQTTFTPPPRRPPEDALYWVFLGIAQASVLVLALLRRRSIR